VDIDNQRLHGWNDHADFFSSRADHHQPPPLQESSWRPGPTDFLNAPMGSVARYQDGRSFR
jgi:hypothetical protein